MPTSQIVKRFRITRIESADAMVPPGGQPPASGSRVTIAAVPAVADPMGGPAGPGGHTWVIDDPNAATFFVVGQEYDLTFTKAVAE